MTHNRFYNGQIKHGISIPECDSSEMLRFLTTPRADADREPPAWGEWKTASESESSETSAESSVSSDDDDDDEYQPFLKLPENPDGRRCRCGSTTHMTINSFACPMNPRNLTENVNGATVGRGDDADAINDNDDDDDADASNDGDDDDDADASDDDDYDDDANASDNDDDDDDADANNDDDDDDVNDNPPDLDSELPPPRRRRRLGLPTRRRGRINAVVANKSIDVGTKVKSPGTRWQLPATTIYNGEVVKVSMFRGALRYEVKWQDGVVEYLRKEHIVPLLC